MDKQVDRNVNMPGNVSLSVTAPSISEFYPPNMFMWQ